MHLSLMLCRSSDDGRWQWSYSSWEDTGLTADLDRSYRTEIGVGDRCFHMAELAALAQRLVADATDLVYSVAF